MLNIAQVEEVATQVNQFVAAALAGPAPADAIKFAATIVQAIITKGVDPAADLAALAAWNQLNTDLINARHAAQQAQAGV